MWPVLLEPTIPILLAAGTVHIIRRNIFDTVLFLGTAVVIVLDRARSRSTRPGGAVVPLGVGWLLALAAVVVGYATVVGAWSLDTLPVKVALVMPGLLAVVVVAARPPAGRVRERQPIGRGWIVWAVLGVGACLWELAAFVQQPDPQTDSYAHPTLSSIIGPTMSSPVVRVGLLGLWLAVSLYLLRIVLVNAAVPKRPGAPGSAAGTSGPVAGRSSPAARQFGDGPPVLRFPDGAP